MERTITVTGKGKLSVKPDTTRLLLSVEGTEPEYEQALARSASQTKSIRTGLRELGFAAEDLKTVSFQVDTKYEGYQDETGKWKQQFLGYQFSHSMKLEFPIDSERLGRILAALVQSQAAPEFHIQYTVKEAEEVKKELLKRAVADSREKAEVMAEAAGVALGELLSMDYSWKEKDLAVNCADRMAKPRLLAEGAPAAAYTLDIEPEDIQVTDSVTARWEIEKIG